jgi:SAM-dependent methyltransferase
MNITQTFYDHLASQYDKLFQDWQATTQEQALILDRIFAANGFDKKAKILDCACGIGTQAIGLAAIGYSVTGSDISDGELDITIVEMFQTHEIPELAFRLMTGTAHKSSRTTCLKGKHVKITRESEGPVHADGEWFEAGKELDIRIEPQLLKVIVPGDKNR